MLLGVLGTNELIIILVALAGIIFFIYQFGKQRGRLKEMDRQLREKNNKSSE